MKCNLWFLLLAKKIKALSTEGMVYVNSNRKRIYGRTLQAQIELMKDITVLREDLTKKASYIWDKREAKELISYAKECWYENK